MTELPEKISSYKFTITYLFHYCFWNTLTPKLGTLLSSCFRIYFSCTKNQSFLVPTSALFTKQKTIFKQRLLSIIRSLSRKSRRLEKKLNESFYSFKRRLLRLANILKKVQNVSTRFLTEHFELKYKCKIWRPKIHYRVQNQIPTGLSLLVDHILTMV